MPNIVRRGKRWRVRIMVDGRKASGTFDTKAQAAAWALAQHKGTVSGPYTLKDAVHRYAREIAPSHRGFKWERTRLQAFEASPIAALALRALGPPQIAAWRDARLWRVTNATVAREMNLLASVLEAARREWRWIETNPIRDVRRPPTPRGRRRRIAQDEIAAMVAAFGLAGGLVAATAMQRVGLAFLFAIETAMRIGEILALTAADIHLSERYVRVRQSKNGDARDVPLSSLAANILALVPDGFDIHPQTRDVFFRRARAQAAIPDLHFHDTRAEAIARLSKKFDVLELARVVGHRDLKSLMHYYNASASELAKRLD